jgi:hypothetical protein
VAAVRLFDAHWAIVDTSSDALTPTST